MVANIEYLVWEKTHPILYLNECPSMTILVATCSEPKYSPLRKNVADGHTENSGFQTLLLAMEVSVHTSRADPHEDRHQHHGDTVGIYWCDVKQTSGM